MEETDQVYKTHGEAGKRQRAVAVVGCVFNQMGL